MSLSDQYCEQLEYSLMVLEGTDPADWFSIPDGASTHIGWQVGHLAVAEYGLALGVCRGSRESDEGLISAAFRSAYGRGSSPVAGPEGNPGADRILELLSGVHRQVLEEVAGFSDDLLAESAGVEHPMFETRGGALGWCIHHEFTHAGQISLLRRLLGYQPRW